MSELNLDLPGELKRVAREIVYDIDQAAIQLYDNGFRRHLGASLIGEPCYRKLWFGFRWVYKVPLEGRQLRLFNRGHREEARFTEWLRLKGHIVNDLDPATGLQWRVDAVGGHFGGSQDGEMFLAPKYNYKEPMLLEYKTNGTGAGFNKVKEQGIRIGKPVHSDQMNTYGTIKKYKYGVYLNVNKNDDDIACEVVKLDWDRGAALETKARVIILSQEAPPRIAENPSAQVCQWCDYKDVCYFREPLQKNCRSCVNASPIADKQWQCKKWNATIPEEAIAAGCGDWTAIYKS